MTAVAFAQPAAGQHRPPVQGIAGQLTTMVTDDVKHAAAHAPRSLQRAPGPSELGTPCTRRLAYKAIGQDTVNNDTDPWASIQGTSVHAWMAALYEARNREARDWWTRCTPARDPVPPPDRYLIEHRVFLPYGISGSSDLFDRETGTVIDWKGLALSTPLPTPGGWTSMAEVALGQQVLDASGRPCTVVAKSPVFGRPCYRITFDDGASVIADNVHEWPVLAGAACTPVILTTEQLRERLFSKHARPARHLRIVTAGALQLPDADLPIAPYVLGAWIGDGISAGGRIGKPDAELFAHIRAEGYETGKPHGQDGMVRNVRGLTAQLRGAGLLGDKHIPAAYLRGSASQRLGLLQGLMDTDGTWNRTRNQAIFTTVSKTLAAAVAELVSTLGWKARVFELTKHGFGLTITAYDVVFTPCGMNPFRLSRKADLVRISGTTAGRRRVVRSVEPVDSVPTQCIEVDSRDHTFLCGEQMIPTRNCTSLKNIAGYRKNGPGAQYRAQAHLYGLGLVLAGEDVKHVADVFLPRGGRITDLHVWTEPFDPAVAAGALARYNTTALALASLDPVSSPERWAMFPTAESHCVFCPYHLPMSSDLGRGCPGHKAAASTATSTTQEK